MSYVTIDSLVSSACSEWPREWSHEWPYVPYKTKTSTLSDVFGTCLQKVQDKIELKENDNIKTLVATFVLPGFGSEELKSVSYDKKTKLLSIIVEEGDARKVSKSLTFATNKGKIDTATFKVISFDKGLLQISAEIKEEDNIIKVV